MKRNTFENIKVQPYTSGDAIDKSGFLSAVLGAKLGAAGDLKIKVSHSDDGTTFEPATDERVFPEAKTENGELTVEGLAKDDIANIDIDLLGLKDFVKIEVSGADATLAIALGDACAMPV